MRKGTVLMALYSLPNYPTYLNPVVCALWTAVSH